MAATSTPAHAIRCAQGQLLPLAAVLLLAVAASVLWMFNSSQLVSEKIRLVNTADAVVYSAGVFEARLLNYDAYTNRAIVANQIAIGQAVGLASWLRYMATSAERIGPYLALLPGVGTSLQVAMLEARTVAELVTPALAASVALHDEALQALSHSQQLSHGSNNELALAARLASMEQVAMANDAAARVDPLPLHDDFAQFTTAYRSAAQRRRLGAVVHASREAFLRSRNWDFGLVVLCTGIELRKRGSTELIDLSAGWKSMDTLSAHHHRLRRMRCRKRERPVGFGSAASAAALDDGGYSYANSRRHNPGASAQAQSASGIARGFQPAPPTLGGGAVPHFHALSPSALAQEDPRSRLSIVVHKAAARQQFSGGSSNVTPRGRLQLFDGAHAGGRSSAAAAVEVFFERPDGGSERGSLFNPYWQAALVPLSAAERSAAQARQGGSQLP